MISYSILSLLTQNKTLRNHIYHNHNASTGSWSILPGSQVLHISASEDHVLQTGPPHFEELVRHGAIFEPLGCAGDGDGDDDGDDGDGDGDGDDEFETMNR